MKRFRKKSKIKISEIVALVIFIVVVSFTAINIKNLLKREEIKNLTRNLNTF